MYRGVIFLAALIAVIVAVGSGLGWVAHHESRYVLALIGALFYGLAGGIALAPVRARAMNSGRWRTIHSLLNGVTPALIGLAGALACRTYVGAYIFIAVGAVPMAIYRWDRRQHKLCPDCAEVIKAKARICRYCGRSVVIPDDPARAVKAAIERLR